MKFNISLAGSIVALAVSLSACESLDFTPADQMSGQTFWKTEEHARQAAVGMYAAMKAPWCFGMEFTFDMCSDIAERDLALGRYFTRIVIRVQQQRRAEPLAISL